MPTSTAFRTSKIGPQRLLPVQAHSASEAEAEVIRLFSLAANATFHLPDGDEVDYKVVEIFKQDADKLHEMLEHMIETAEWTLPAQYCLWLDETVNGNANVFHIRLENDPTVDFSPMHIKFEDEDRLMKVRQRTYSPQQTENISKKCKELVRLSFIYRNLKSKCSCAPAIVPKHSSETFRFTSNLRLVDARTKKSIWPIPQAEAMLAHFAGPAFFLHDFLHGFWQFLLGKLS